MLKGLEQFVACETLSGKIIRINYIAPQFAKAGASTTIVILIVICK